MELKSATYTQDGAQVDCEVNHPSFGWIPFTANADDTDSFAQKVWAAVQGQKIAPAPRPSLVDRYDAAMARVNAMHANVLQELTGAATAAERDTWQTKEAAARAFEDGTATSGQTAMLELEAKGGGVEVSVLAKIILEKADTYRAMVGAAAGVRAKAKAAITKVTDGSVSAEKIGPELDAVLEQLSTDADAIVAEWRK